MQLHARVSCAALIVAGVVGSVGVAPAGYAAAGAGALRPSLWVVHHRAPSVQNTEGVGAGAEAVTPDGDTVIVVGSRPGSPIVAYDTATGAKRWVADGPAYVSDLAITPDGATVIVVGTTAGKYPTVAYDTATGIRKWIAHGGVHGDSVAVTPDGATVIVTGAHGNINKDNFDYATVAYDTATGGERWVARYDGPAHFNDFARSLAITPDGATVVVTGQSYGSGDPDYWDYATVAYDTATGAERWVARYVGPGPIDDEAYATAVAVTPDGATVVVTGNDDDYGRDHVATVAYDTTSGAQKWVALYQGPAHSAFAEALAITSDGGTVVVTGSSYGKTHNDYATVAYDTVTGAQRWVARYDGPAHRNDYARALAITPDGATVIVTGSSHGKGTANLRHFDFATVAYDTATGAEKWVARYANARHPDDQPTAAAITPDGATVVVTGQSRSDDSFGEWTTIAYPITARA